MGERENGLFRGQERENGLRAQRTERKTGARGARIAGLHGGQRGICTYRAKKHANLGFPLVRKREKVLDNTSIATQTGEIMKTINVSESALDSIKNMAVDREQRIVKLQDALMEILQMAQNQNIVFSRTWEDVEKLCKRALCE